MPAPRPVALVTGASAGIGREIARILARDHDLVLTARRESELQVLAAELAPATCHVLPADLADPAAPLSLVGEVNARGLTIDVLVNNAGFGDLGPFAEADLARMLRMIQVNITALTELTGFVLPGMLARKKGRILNVGSVAGFQPGPLMAVYYATKAYVNSFSEALANEVEGTGVTVTCLAPGANRNGIRLRRRHAGAAALGLGRGGRCAIGRRGGRARNDAGPAARRDRHCATGCCSSWSGSCRAGW